MLSEVCFHIHMKILFFTATNTRRYFSSSGVVQKRWLPLLADTRKEDSLLLSKMLAPWRPLKYGSGTIHMKLSLLKPEVGKEKRKLNRRKLMG